MRLCIAATADLGKLSTITGSEPYLAEAARELMSGVGTVKYLAKNASLDCVDRGQRGELVATMLIMRARDAAADVSGGRVVSVNDFMKALLPIKAYEELESMKPHYSKTTLDQKKTFPQIFEDYSTVEILITHNMILAQNVMHYRKYAR